MNFMADQLTEKNGEIFEKAFIGHLEVVCVRFKQSATIGIYAEDVINLD